MELKIENCKDVQFILYLISFLKRYIVGSIDNRKLYALNMYIDSLPEYKSKLRRSINCKEIITIGAYNLTYYKYNGDLFIIKIDSNQKIFGLDIKVEDACRLINYGTLNVSGYPIFTEAFKYIEENLDILHYRYTRGI